jgi:hypothetical protein
MMKSFFGLFSGGMGIFAMILYRNNLYKDAFLLWEWQFCAQLGKIL